MLKKRGLARNQLRRFLFSVLSSAFSLEQQAILRNRKLAMTPQMSLYILMTLREAVAIVYIHSSHG